MEIKRKIFLFTGGTGFLGSHIGVEFLRRGHRVIFIARPKKGLSARERIVRLMDWFGLEQRDGVEVVEGYLDQSGLGLEPILKQSISGRVDEVFHCGADTSFSARRVQSLRKINVESIKNLFDLIRRGNCRRFHHMSTAYVFGKSQGLCLEEATEKKGFYNEYEHSKEQAERELSSLCEEAGMAFCIYRPSIVYGDSRSGRSLSFNALYYPVRILLLVRDMLERDLKVKDGQQAKEMGVSILPDGKMRMPIRVGVNGTGSINVIPIDHLVKSVLALMDQEDAAGIYHIVNSNRLKLRDLVQMIQATYRIAGIQTVPEGEIEGTRRNPLETLVDSYMEVYKPYLNDPRVFDDIRARPILRSAGIDCPPLTLEIFQNCMEYAQEVDWGNRLNF